MATQYMNFIDVIILLLFIAMIFKGAYAGFVSQMSFFVGLILGISISSQTYLLLAQKIQANFESFSTACIISYIIIFFLVFIATGFLGKYIKNLFALKITSWLDHLVGGILAFFIAMLLCAFLLMLANKIEELQNPIQNSVLVPYVNKIVGGFRGLLPNDTSSI